ncbi:Coatomer beta' subunit [Neofusicoccum parvum]|uniref:Coatomer beta' subunit n=1 Tax=Neofusicoccum parvum TaxID=310453 RepID=A0ACB5S1R1_9PEZI|nr:Coatomer beta' subunit [Neofusicoccum parvum]
MSTLPPRKRLRATHPSPTWHHTAHTDHAGAPAHTLWLGTTDSPPSTPAHQLYVTFPLAAALPYVRRLAAADLLPPPARFDVYAADAFADVFACVAHQRRESGGRGGAGLVVVVTEEGGGEGPLLVWFERGGRAEVRVPGDLEGEEGGELALERVELRAVRVRDWGRAEAELAKVGVEEGGGDGGEEPTGGAEERGKEEEEEEEEEEGRGVEEHQLVTKRITDSAGKPAVSVTNAREAGAEDRCDLHYIVYDLNSSDDGLSSVATLFTSTLLSHCAPGTTALLEFHPASSLGASIEHFRHEQQARPELNVGYLSQPSSESGPVYRIFPSSPEIEAGIDKHRAATLGAGMPLSGFNVFFVALESHNFAREDSVLLVRADPDFPALRKLMGKNSEEGEDEAGMGAVGSAVEILVGRPPGMETVAKRLCGTL